MKSEAVLIPLEITVLEIVIIQNLDCHSFPILFNQTNEVQIVGQFCLPLYSFDFLGDIYSEICERSLQNFFQVSAYLEAMTVHLNGYIIMKE